MALFGICNTNLLNTVCCCPDSHSLYKLKPIKLFEARISRKASLKHFLIRYKVFKNGPSKICGRQPLKNMKRYGLFKQTTSFQMVKGCLPQILLRPFLNTFVPYLLDEANGNNEYLMWMLDMNTKPKFLWKNTIRLYRIYSNTRVWKK